MGLLQTLSALFTSYSITIYQIVFFRMCFGICYGLTYPLVHTCNLEITPLQYRGKATICLNYFTTFGRLAAIVLAIHAMPGLVSEEWRYFMKFTAGFCILAPFLVHFILDDTPRYLMSK